jgi:hypothetical protein
MSFVQIEVYMRVGDNVMQLEEASLLQSGCTASESYHTDDTLPRRIHCLSQSTDASIFDFRTADC